MTPALPSIDPDICHLTIVAGLGFYDIDVGLRNIRNKLVNIKRGTFCMGEEIDRRPLSKAIGATIGTGTAISILPKSWTRPLVHSVIVPAHAASSRSGTTATTVTTVTTQAP